MQSSVHRDQFRRTSPTRDLLGSVTKSAAHLRTESLVRPIAHRSQTPFILIAKCVEYPQRIGTFFPDVMKLQAGVVFVPGELGQARVIVTEELLRGVTGSICQLPFSNGGQAIRFTLALTQPVAESLRIVPADTVRGTLLRDGQVAIIRRRRFARFVSPCNFDRQQFFEQNALSVLGKAAQHVIDERATAVLSCGLEVVACLIGLPEYFVR